MPERLLTRVPVERTKIPEHPTTAQVLHHGVDPIVKAYNTQNENMAKALAQQAPCRD